MVARALPPIVTGTAGSIFWAFSILNLQDYLQGSNSHPDSIKFFEQNIPPQTNPAPLIYSVN